MLRPKKYAGYRYHIVRVDGMPGVVSASNEFADALKRVSKWNEDYGYRRYAVTCPPVLDTRPTR